MIEPQEKQYLGVSETIILFALALAIFDVVVVALARLTGASGVGLLNCLNPFFYVAAGFVAARYGRLRAGVWAGMGLAALDLLITGLLALLVGDISEQLAVLQPMMDESGATGIVAVVMTVALIVALLVSAVFGAICGLIGAGISRIEVFRPREPQPPVVPTDSYHYS